MVGFKVNDTYLIPKRPLIERPMLIHHRQRKFGRGCVHEMDLPPTRKLPVPPQDEITQSETPATLVPGDQYEAVTFVALFLLMSPLIRIAS
jgi:hypothetical protein